LSALGIGQFALDNLAPLEFGSSLQMHFDYREAFLGKAIREIRCPPTFVDGQQVDTLCRKMVELRMIAAFCGPQPVT
jgi:hypothetical protein